ncbi:MAG: PilZ domain-containing protein [Thermodesulfovibrionales bacterium]
MKRVIIAEDIYAVLRREKNFLGRSDISITAADSNSRAFALHREKQADLIVARLDDKELPGEKFCNLIRKDSKLCNVSIIIVCSGDNADLKRCVKCSANVFIPSPVNTAILLQEAYQLLSIAPRKSFRIEVKVKCEGTSKGRPFSGHTENISTTGLLLNSRAVLLEGDIIVCSFSPPGSRQLTATAEVVRVIAKKQGKENTYGVYFTDISSEAVSAIVVLTGE